MTAIQPNEMTRELRLKVALARLLPDDIEITDLCNFVWKRGLYVGEMLRDTEWEHVVRMAMVSAGFVVDEWHRKAEMHASYLGITKWDKPR